MNRFIINLIHVFKTYDFKQAVPNIKRYGMKTFFHNARIELTRGATMGPGNQIRGHRLPHPSDVVKDHIDSMNKETAIAEVWLKPISHETEDKESANMCQSTPIVVEDKYYFDLSAEPVSSTSLKPIAFYLPQFHRIPENDEWWGKGFTEWTTTRKSRPLFVGHHQPRTPSYLGYYNLDNIEDYKAQVLLAKKAGIYGFCFYFYWFHGKTLLEKPLRNMLAHPGIDQPFCLCWANENWTRRWDGQDNEILIAQEHSEEDSIAFLDYINTYFKDERYIKIDGKPLLIVYRAGIIPDITDFQQQWREHAEELGWPGIYLISAQTFGQKNPREFQFDAAVQFPPHHQCHKFNLKHEIPGLTKGFMGNIFDYRNMANQFCNNETFPDYKLFRGVTLSWDNTARSGKNATILHDFSLTSYAQWLSAACKTTLEDSQLAAQEKYVFINAWNEWSEGTYLEPDSKYGFGYLEATKKALISCSEKNTRISVIVPNYNHEVFIERRLASIIGQTCQPDEIIFLDDASSDNSLAIATDILANSNIRFSIIRNERNSGNVFSQWLKGIELATGDLLWIAESDDEAAPEFLANIIPQFEREEVLLAYGDITYINVDGSRNSGLSTYYDALNDLDWNCSHIVTANSAFQGPFAVKNIIPNVSGALFKKPFLTDQEKNHLISYSFAGDWYFYALIARGGSIAFCKEAKSYFRLHQRSTSRKVFFSDKHIQEHKMILQDLHDIYNIGQKTVRRHVDTLSQVLNFQSPDISPNATKSIKLPTMRRHNLKVCIASHSFSVGGGEAVPIDIANALKSLGNHITFLIFKRNIPEEQFVLRRRLRSDIPVVYWDDVKHRFNDFIKDHGIEIFNSHNVGVEYELYRSGILMGIPYIASLHGGYETVPNLLTAEFIEYLKETVNEWLYLSNKNIEPLRARGLTDVIFTKSFNTTIPRFSNIGRELNIRKSLGIEKDAVLMVLASRALYNKGWQTAINVTKELRESTGRDFRLLLIGDGPDLHNLKASNADKDYVIFVGRIDNPFPIIKECDLGIFPSTYSGESFPLFILECLQSGLPVIATDIGEIVEIMKTIKGEMPGHIVSSNLDEKMMAQEMTEVVKVLVNDDEKMSTAKQRALQVAQHFSNDKLLNIYLGVFIKHLNVSSEGKFIFRDPNTLYKINNIVGSHDTSEEKEDRIVVRGQIDKEAVTSYSLDHIIVLDISGRYVIGTTLGPNGRWSIEMDHRNFGNDNSYLYPNIFAGGQTHNFIFPLKSGSSAAAVYSRFVKSRLPANSKDVPSIKNELRELIIKATRVPYVSRSIHQSITTGNNYQTLALDDTQRRGGRPPREQFLRQIDFTNKTVLDVGANTGENSRIVRRLGASLVDGYEFDPYFVEIGRTINTYAGMTRVSLFQGDCTCADIFHGMKFDIVMALAVWVYIENTIEQIAEITDILIFETHTLDHGIEFYYQPIIKYFPHVISLGYTEKPANPHKSRMFVVFGKDKASLNGIVAREFLKVKPYFDNNFVQRHRGLDKSQILELAGKCHEKHVGRSAYDKEEYVYGTDTYFEVFLAGLHQFSAKKKKIENLITPDNLYLKFLKRGIKRKILDQNLKDISNNTDWMVRKVSNKYEDAINILNGHIDRLAPVEIVPESNGQLTFTTTSDEKLSCEIFDGHHRFFMLQLVGAEKIHFVRNDGKGGDFTQHFSRNVASNYTLTIH